MAGFFIIKYYRFLGKFEFKNNFYPTVNKKTIIQVGKN